MKGVILAAGRGTRLYPITKVVPKVLLPIYDKPMIFYSIETLMEADVQEILVVTSASNYGLIKDTIGDYYKDKVNIEYEIVENPKGSADSFKVSKKFLGDSPCVLMYADNIIFGSDMKPLFDTAFENLKDDRASIFSYRVENPKGYGILELDETGKVLSLEEKPEKPKTDIAAIGLYVFPSDVVSKAESVPLSIRGEYEMADVNTSYLNEDRLCAVNLDNNYKWFDTGTVDAMLEATIEAKRRSKGDKN